MAPSRAQNAILHSNSVRLEGDWWPPRAGCGAILFAHGSGSSRHSPRNVRVATELRDAGFGTLLFDLLTPGEDLDRAARFDIGILTKRLLDATAWVESLPEMKGVPVGYFGASTGAAAALCAAAAHPRIAAVVSRGGRPDLAGGALARVQAPTLLIVGEADSQVLDLNRHAASQLAGRHDLAIVPGATHLFEEPGTLEEVVRLAAWWFGRHLKVVAGRPRGRTPRIPSMTGGAS